jgi:hypothetical protein
LSLESNNLQAAGGKALAEGLKGNQVITELNIASNELGWTDGVGPDMSGVVALADIVPNMGAMTQLDVSSNNLAGKKWNNSNQDYDYDFTGIQALANTLPKCQ